MSQHRTDELLNSIASKLDGISGGIGALNEKKELSVDVLHVPTDIYMLAATVLTSFLGAYFAYKINDAAEARKEKAKQIQEINLATNSLLLTLNTLLNFKRQFLIAYILEVNELKKHALMFKEHMSAFDFGQYIATTDLIVRRFNPSDGGDAVFQKWDELEFPRLFSYESLVFMLEYRPDDIRVFDVVRDQIQTINRNIKLRNVLWPLIVRVARAQEQPTSENMGNLYEFLAYRYNISEATDLAIAAIRESLERINEYKEHAFVRRKIFGIKVGRKVIFMEWGLPPEAEALFPDKSLYEKVLRRPPVKKLRTGKIESEG